MFVNTLNTTDYKSDSEIKTAGKVIFNASANDCVTDECFKVLRFNILFSSENIKTILVTSTLENEGKSTIATELAKSFSAIDKKVLLIDADMRKSMLLHKSVRTSKFMGLSEFLSGQASLEQILYSTQKDNFDIIFSGHFPPNPVELLESERFKKLIEFTKQQYDYIFIDTPPLGQVIDAAVIAASSDSAVFVVNSGKTPIRLAKDAKAQLVKSGCKILGAVINNAEPSNKYYKRKYKYN